jgi:TonB-linked SusC/RagA family outer membrane protein
MRKLTLILTLLLFAGFTATAQMQISGEVTNAETGEPIPGVSIVVKSQQTIGTTTDLDGTYSFEAPSDAETLVFSFVGMQTKEVPINGRTTIDVEMTPTVEEMEEVVVTALGISREKKSLGYSVQEVGGEELTDVPQQNPINALSGKVAGIHIRQSTGGVASSSRITIRGNSSFTGNQPLFVVDGTPISNRSNQQSQWGGTDYGNAAMDLDPENIKSISVLKGANAAAIYGSRASNGVILITTKGGQAQQGLGVTVNSTVTFDDAYVIPNYQNKYGQGFNGSEYIAKLNDVDVSNLEAYNNYAKNNAFSYFNGNWGGVMDGMDESWGPRLDIGLELPQWDSPYTMQDGTPQFEATPWVSQPGNVESFFETGVTFNNNVSFSGGTEDAKGRLSVSRMDTKGAVPNTDLKKTNVQFNGTLNLSDRLSTNTMITYVRNESENLPGHGYDANNPMQQLGGWFGRQVDVEKLKEKYDERDAYGRPYNWNHSYHSNPYWIQNKNLVGRSRDRIYGNFDVTYQLADWLSAKARIGTDVYTEERPERRVKESVNYPNGFYDLDQLYEEETNADLIFNGNTDLSQDFSLDFTLGANYRYSQYKFYSQTANELTVAGVYNIENAVGTPAVTENFEEKETNSVYGQASVGFRDYLFLDVTGRNDWSSTLPVDDWSYFYPSASLSFIFSDAFALPDVLSFGKVSASWANVGNDTDPYRLNLTYPSHGSAISGVTQFRLPNRIPNTSLKPENIESTEFGLQLNFLEGKIAFDGTYYHKSTTNQLMAIDIPTSSGFETQMINAGEITNQGFELSLNLTPFENPQGFTWDIGFNWAKDQSEVKELYGDLETYRLTTSWGSLSVEARPGEEFGAIYGVGHLRDDEGNVVVNSSGLPMKTSTPKKLGSAVPDWTGGIRNTFSYRNLSLTVLVDGRKGGDVFSVSDWFGSYAGLTEVTAEGDIRENGLVVGEDVLSDENIVMFEGRDEEGNVQVNKNAEIPAVAPQSYYSNYWGMEEPSVIDGSYIKLREATLSYRLPSKVLRNTFLQSATLSLVGRNLAMLWVHESNHVGIDPETGYGTGLSGLGLEQFQLPPTRSLGVKLGLKF